MTIESSIEVALFTKVLSLDLLGEPAFSWPNVSFTPPSGTYIKVEHIPNRNTRMLVKGSAPHIRQGILQLTVVTPLNDPCSIATNMAGEVAEHFPADLALYDDDVKVRIQQAPDVLPAEKTDVSWNVRVDVRYEALI